MLSHDKLWTAIDALADKRGFTPSGLARKAGLDPTTFNKSKRLGSDGRPRWPSTESLAKVLDATRTSFEEFVGLVDPAHAPPPMPARGVPLIGLARAGDGGFFDESGYPVGNDWDEVPFPGLEPPGGVEGVYALEITGDSMQPLYRDGDIIIVSPAAQVRRGDRVVVRTVRGEVLAKILARRTTRQIELHSMNPDHPDRVLPVDEVAWLARILWASQ
jgi:phage repressor protein C with HTH and peptisase S24 domain